LGYVRVSVTVPRGLIEEILAVKTTSHRTPRDELMERARSYKASLEAMYINDHPHVGLLIHPDHRRNLQTLLPQYYEDILDMKGA
jgi:histidinol phosphatase-like PHP family hydrolase